MPISESRNFIPTRITTRTDTKMPVIETMTTFNSCSRSKHYQDLGIIPMSVKLLLVLIRKMSFISPVTNRTSHVTSLSSLATINVRSLRNRLLNVKHYIYEHDIDIVALTETWLTSQANMKH